MTSTVSSPQLAFVTGWVSQGNKRTTRLLVPADCECSTRAASILLRRALWIDRPAPSFLDSPAPWGRLVRLKWNTRFRSGFCGRDSVFHKPVRKGQRRGGAFTNFDKKNFRMYFRSQYGASKLRHPLFEGFDRGITATDTFDQLNIRSGSHDMVARGFYMSNRFTDDTMLDMGNINPHGRFMHLYINGKYWGVFHLRERWNADHLTEYLGGPKEGYEAINGNWNVGGWADSVAPPYDGDGSAWERIKTLALTSNPQNFDELSPYLD
ncbi:CotH kinase family protein, partial [Akkermansiaceae bacterium]|nr:CotH kinase family protein [Akkermansiaceae bacterium]